MLYYELVSVFDPGLKYQLLSFPFIVGRDIDADLPCVTRSVSKCHAKLTMRNGKLYVRDYSLNGTYINGVRIEADVNTVLEADEEIAFGFPREFIETHQVAPPYYIFILKYQTERGNEEGPIENGHSRCESDVLEAPSELSISNVSEIDGMNGVNNNNSNVEVINLVIGNSCEIVNIDVASINTGSTIMLQKKGIDVEVEEVDDDDDVIFLGGDKLTPASANIQDDTIKIKPELPIQIIIDDDDDVILISDDELNENDMICSQLFLKTEKFSQKDEEKDFQYDELLRIKQENLEADLYELNWDIDEDDEEENRGSTEKEEKFSEETGSGNNLCLVPNKTKDEPMQIDKIKFEPISLQIEKIESKTDLQGIKTEYEVPQIQMKCKLAEMQSKRIKSEVLEMQTKEMECEPIQTRKKEIENVVPQKQAEEPLSQMKEMENKVPEIQSKEIQFEPPQTQTKQIENVVPERQTKENELMVPQSQTKEMENKVPQMQIKSKEIQCEPPQIQTKQIECIVPQMQPIYKSIEEILRELEETPPKTVSAISHMVLNHDDLMEVDHQEVAAKSNLQKPEKPKSKDSTSKASKSKDKNNSKESRNDKKSTQNTHSSRKQKDKPETNKKNDAHSKKEETSKVDKPVKAKQKLFDCSNNNNVLTTCESSHHATNTEISEVTKLQLITTKINARNKVHLPEVIAPLPQTSRRHHKSEHSDKSKKTSPKGKPNSKNTTSITSKSNCKSKETNDKDVKNKENDKNRKKDKDKGSKLNGEKTRNDKGKERQETNKENKKTDNKNNNDKKKPETITKENKNKESNFKRNQSPDNNRPKATVNQTVANNKPEYSKSEAKIPQKRPNPVKTNETYNKKPKLSHDSMPPPSTIPTRPSTIPTAPSKIPRPPSAIASRPSTIVTPPSTIVTLPSTIVTPPSTIVTRPSTIVTPPYTIVTPPSTIVTRPSIIVTPPSTIPIRPSTISTAPSTIPRHSPPSTIPRQSPPSTIPRQSVPITPTIPIVSMPSSRDPRLRLAEPNATNSRTITNNSTSAPTQGTSSALLKPIPPIPKRSNNPSSSHSGRGRSTPTSISPLAQETNLPSTSSYNMQRTNLTYQHTNGSYKHTNGSSYQHKNGSYQHSNVPNYEFLDSPHTNFVKDHLEFIQLIFKWRLDVFVQPDQLNMLDVWPQLTGKPLIKLANNYAMFQYYKDAMRDIILNHLITDVHNDYHQTVFNHTSEKANFVFSGTIAKVIRFDTHTEIVCFTYLDRNTQGEKLFISETNLVSFTAQIGQKAVTRTQFGIISNANTRKITEMDSVNPAICKMKNRGYPTHKLTFTIIAGKDCRVRDNIMIGCRYFTSLYRIFNYLNAVKKVNVTLQPYILSPNAYLYQLPSIIPKFVDIPQLPPLNEKQTLVVADAIKLCDPEIKSKILLIEGPPGTGKSFVIINIILQLLLQAPKASRAILLLAHSNAAIDTLLIKMRSLREKLPIDQQKYLKMVRIGQRNSILPEASLYHIDTLVDTNLRNSLFQTSPQLKLDYESLTKEFHDLEAKTNRTKEEEILYRKKRDEYNNFTQNHFIRNYAGERRKQRDVMISKATLICSTLGSCCSFQNQRYKIPFTCCIIDEATQATEPETLVPLVLGIEKFILVGDTNQLPAYSNLVPKDYLFGRSLFERLYATLEKFKPKPIRSLNVQYRMVPAISEFPNTKFYNGNLRNFYSRSLKHDLRDMVPYAFFEHFNEYKRNSLYINQTEVDIVISMVNIIQFNIQPREPISIGIITPYTEQKNYINERLKDLTFTSNKYKVSCNTIDNFQGQEEDIIIISLVRNIGNNFVNDPQRMNVALTRAKSALYIVASTVLCHSSPVIEELYEDAVRRALRHSLADAKVNLRRYIFH